jgi:GNAT superfamily N-acetyltransferase
MEIKEAGIFDIPKIRKIIVDDRAMFDNPIFAVGAAPGYSTWSGIKPVLKYLTAVVHPRRRLFFAIDGKSVLGVAVISNRNFIDGFFINKEYRGKGFGRVLMDHVCSLIRRESGTVRVGVQSVNETAMKFYKKCGFSVNEYILDKKLR